MMCSHVLRETYCVMLCVKYVLCSCISSVFVLPFIRLVGFHVFVQLLEQRHLNLQIRMSDTQEFFFMNMHKNTVMLLLKTRELLVKIYDIYKCTSDSPRLCVTSRVLSNNFFFKYANYNC